MRKRGICCHPVSDRLTRSCTVSKRLKISSNFFLGPVAPLLQYFLTPSAGTQFQGNPSAGPKLHVGRKNLLFSTEIAIYLGNGKYRPVVATER